MGNRAIIRTENGHIGMYLHWNGGRDSVEAFLKYCELRGFRSPEVDGYGWARLAQVVGNYFGGGLSVGIIEVTGVNDGEWCDNGTYIIRDWQIVGREDFEGCSEQHEYKLDDMLLEIDKAQPEDDRLGALFLSSPEVPVSEVKVGDRVFFRDNSGEVEHGLIIGIGGYQTVNGRNVDGIPYMDRFGFGNPADNINNYLHEKTVRVVR